MKFTILGSCSGTEPMPGRRHESVALELGGHLYLFDAGDSCGYNAFNMGIDVTKIEALFISHPHSDHIGGLPYLFFLMRKLHWRRGTHEEGRLQVRTPALEVFEGVKLIEKYCNNPTLDNMDVRLISDGVIFDDGNIRVTARHNGHMGETAAPWHSYSFLIEGGNKKAVYSGDVKSITELEGWLDCDLLIMETGHHDSDEIAEYLHNQPVRPGMLVFNHHGRKTLADPEGCEARARELLGENTFVAYDGMEISV